LGGDSWSVGRAGCVTCGLPGDASPAGRGAGAERFRAVSELVRGLRGDYEALAWCVRLCLRPSVIAWGRSTTTPADGFRRRGAARPSRREVAALRRPAKRGRGPSPRREGCLCGMSTVSRRMRQREQSSAHGARASGSPCCRMGGRGSLPCETRRRDQFSGLLSSPFLFPVGGCGGGTLDRGGGAWFVASPRRENRAAYGGPVRARPPRSGVSAGGRRPSDAVHLASGRESPPPPPRVTRMCGSGVSAAAAASRVAHPLSLPPARRVGCRTLPLLLPLPLLAPPPACWRHAVARGGLT